MRILVTWVGGKSGVKRTDGNGIQKFIGMVVGPGRYAYRYR